MHIPKLKPVKALRKGYKDKSERARARESESARESVRECASVAS